MRKKYFPNLKLLVSPPEGKNDLYPFVWDTFELLGITRDDVIFLDTKTRYNTVLVGSSLTHDGLSDVPPHKGIFNIIKPNLLVIVQTWELFTRLFRTLFSLD